MSDYSVLRLSRCGLAALTILTLVGLNFFLQLPAVYMRQLLPYLPALATAPALAKTYHDDVGVLRYVNPKIGTYGVTPNGNGGMIPSVSVPFGMTRWTPQTRENFISQCPYNNMDGHIHGFQATHQPAIWMGESGQVVINPGVGDVRSQFAQRGHSFRKENEVSTPYVYEVTLGAETMQGGYDLTESIYSPVPGGGQPVPSDVREGANGRIRRDAVLDEAIVETPSHHPDTEDFGADADDSGTIGVALTATSHVGLLRFDFSETCSRHSDKASKRAPYVFVQATRQNWTGTINIDPEKLEVSGNNPQRQDYALGPSRAPGFSGYFVSRFSEPFNAYGITNQDQTLHGSTSGNGEDLGAYVTFAHATKEVEVRTAVSFVSVEQARRNLEFDVPDETTFQKAVENVKEAWLDNLGRVTIEGVNETDAEHDPQTVWYTGLFHALQYPNDFSEPLTHNATRKTFYSGYTDSVHTSNDSYYQSWSIWDTYRAEHSLLTLFAPERVNGMMRSLLRIYEWAGWLPMWANIVETNVMIGTHVDAVFANALERGFRSFNITEGWEAVKKNAFTPPINDTALLYYDREPYTPDEVRAGLTYYLEHGYIPNDRWAESASRTLDYAFDDYAAAVVAKYAGDETAARELRHRSQNYHKIFNSETGLMEAKNANGTWAGSDQGWTEGDNWVYTFNIMHDPEGLAEMVGGPAKLKARLDEHFQGGHNDHTNEPSHHVPYLYAALGYPASTQNLTRAIAAVDYNATSAGLSGNEDLGQMSAWYVFSALGFYPVDPASDGYIVGAPFFEKVTIRLPPGAGSGGEGGQEHELMITAPGAPTMPFVKSLHVDGQMVDRPGLTHGQIVNARHIAFEMADTPQAWGTRDRQSSG
ncbi:hypothetical protein KC354_g1281 [Hortaea werneckii]|nr:hypothetical protein KC354_g1281 [Hortaea werneckii]